MSITKTIIEITHDDGYKDSLLDHINIALRGKDMEATAIINLYPENQETNNYQTLINRLRGIYTIPIKDGAGPLNGKTQFTQKFEGLPPINEEAAKAIEHLLQNQKP